MSDAGFAMIFAIICIAVGFFLVGLGVGQWMKR